MQRKWNRLYDKAILAINRGAEDAVGFAKPIFVDAIKEMTLKDALNIIKGPKDGATNYFKDRTKEKLITAFTPSVKSSLDKTDATKYYSDIITSYNKLPTTFKKINPDLTSYVVGRAVDALFDQVAKEEANLDQEMFLPFLHAGIKYCLHCPHCFPCPMCKI